MTAPLTVEVYLRYHHPGDATNMSLFPGGSWSTITVTLGAHLSKGSTHRIAPGEWLPLVTFCPLGICFQPPALFPTWLLGLCIQTIQFPIWPYHFLECWMTLDKLFNISELQVP